MKYLVKRNFMGCFIRQGGRKNDAKRLSVVQDYILVYVKSDDYLKRNNIKWKERKGRFRCNL